MNFNRAKENSSLARAPKDIDTPKAYPELRNRTLEAVQREPGSLGLGTRLNEEASMMPFSSADMDININVSGVHDSINEEHHLNE